MVSVFPPIGAFSLPCLLPHLKDHPNFTSFLMAAFVLSHLQYRITPPRYNGRRSALRKTAYSQKRLRHLRSGLAGYTDSHC